MRYFIYFICIVLITMLMVYIGTIKEKNIDVELTNKLYTKCVEKVLKYLNKNKYAYLNDIQNLVGGISTSMFWTRKRVKVENPYQFSKMLMDKLYKQDKISIEMKKNKQVFIIKEKAK